MFTHFFTASKKVTSQANLGIKLLINRLSCDQLDNWLALTVVTESCSNIVVTCDIPSTFPQAKSMRKSVGKVASSLGMHSYLSAPPPAPLQSCLPGHSCTLTAIHTPLPSHTCAVHPPLFTPPCVPSPPNNMSPQVLMLLYHPHIYTWFPMPSWPLTYSLQLLIDPLMAICTQHSHSKSHHTCITNPQLHAHPLLSLSPRSSHLPACLLGLKTFCQLPY